MKTCPHCLTKVLFTEDKFCPACRKNFDSPLEKDIETLYKEKLDEKRRTKIKILKKAYLGTYILFVAIGMRFFKRSIEHMNDLMLVIIFLLILILPFIYLYYQYKSEDELNTPPNKV